MSSGDTQIIRVGSRKSELALIQTKYVISCLQKLYPDIVFEIHTMTTVGDRVLNKSLPKIGEKSLFTKDLEDALRNGGVDFVVHSLKDLPTSLPVGMAIGAVLKREDPRDALVLNEKYRGLTLATLPKGSVIGTSSLRRSAQLSRDYTHLVVCDIRGNLNTRLAKLDAPNSKFSGIILAQAGLVRMGWEKRIDQVLEPAEILYAVGQGALAVECRSNDDHILEMLSHLSHIDTQCIILAERSFLKTLGGGCSAPVAVCTNLKRKNDNNFNNCELDIVGAVWSLDGKIKITEKLGCSIQVEEDEIDNEVIPAKRMKLNGNNDSKRKSPEIIDDSKLASSSCMSNKSGTGDCLASNLDIEAIINIHGELFKKCPYSLQHQQDKLKGVNDLNGNAPNGNTNNWNNDDNGCPLNIPVGQDFMGQCPYFNIQQKVDMLEVCPVTGRRRTISENNNVDKCPFTLAITNEIEKSISNDTATSTDKCPFLASVSKQDVKLIEYDSNVNYIQPKMVDDSDKLFCGMHRYKNIDYELFRKCEDLGKSLAESLISNGALDVMKIAQDEIHGSIKVS